MKRYIRSDTASNRDLAIFSTDPKELAELANDDDKWTRYHVAKNLNTPVDVLAQLANDENEDVRKRVARNPNTPANALAQLADDKYPELRCSVASNPSTPADVLEQLANDKNQFVRIAVAENLNTPTNVLVQLANDKESFVRRYVAKQPNTPSDVLVQLADDEDESVSKCAVNNPNCPVKSMKSKKSNESPKWPSADAWYNIESDEAFENMWSRYLAGPEDEVNKQLQIFTEPSIQGGAGGMFIFDESEESNESFSIDFQNWCDRELNMAAESKNANEYKQKYTAFVEDLIAEHWR